MYHRNPGYIDIDRLTKTVRVMSEPAPMSPANRLLLSVGLIIAPVASFFLVIGIGRLIAAF